MTQQEEMYYAIKEAIQVLEKDFIKKYVEIDSDGREVVLLSDIGT